MYTVDIDTGGTMTDCLVTGNDGRQIFLKVDTTPHDYMVSFRNCLDEAASMLGTSDIQGFLSRVALIRWSSTITTNVIAERNGAKLGLIVSAGSQENLYGRARSPLVDELVDADNVIGVPANPEAERVLAAVKELLEAGVRRICVSLQGAFPSNEAEIRLKDVIEEQYPDHIIGSVPVLLGSEMAQIAHDQTRTHYSIMNAYTHTHLATSLFKAEDMLREECGWSGALLVGHTSGGVARIGKTKAVDTIESGPVFGTFGAAFLAREYNLENLICLDVGGTTTKASIVRGGEPVFQRGGELMEVPVNTSLALLRSAPIGGGSVARVKDGTLTLGPDSMGAAPGPACYGLGGDQATLTDALLILGYLDPKNFLGGRRELKVDRAREVIKRQIADPLSVDTQRAALAIRDEAASHMAELITGTLHEAKLDASDCVLFTYGGNGPMFGAFVAERLGIATVHAFNLGPVFSAFGSAISDVVHVYERGIGAPWSAANGKPLIEAASSLYRQAIRDLEGEGFDPGIATFRYQIEFGGDEKDQRSAVVDVLRAPGDAWLKEIAQAATTAGIKQQDSVLLVALTSRYVVGAHKPRKLKAGNETMRSEKRSMFFGGAEASSSVAANWESMQIGDRVDGPAMINGATLTCAVPPGWSAAVDDYGNVTLTRR